MSYEGVGATSMCGWWLPLSLITVMCTSLASSPVSSKLQSSFQIPISSPRHQCDVLAACLPVRVCVCVCGWEWHVQLTTPRLTEVT